MSVRSFLDKLKQSTSIPIEETGMWYQNKDVIIPSNKITMKGPKGEPNYFKNPIIGKGVDSGETQIMYPGNDYEFPNDSAVYEKQMQFGGSINNISKEGNVDFSMKPKGNLAFGVSGSGNIPNMQLNSLTPSLSYKDKGFNAILSPNNFNASYEGDKGYINYNQSKEGEDTFRTGTAGYNTDKFNLNANATMRNNELESAGIQGSYNLTPNLSVSGNYNINRGEQGMDKDYFAGFKYLKSFEDGGMADESVTCSNCGWSWKISEGGLNPLSCHKCGGKAKMQMGGMSVPGVNGSVVSNTNAPILRNKQGYKQGGNIDHSDDKDMVNGVASILRRVKDKDNRLQLANQLSSQFKREKVNYNLNDFLNKSKVKK